MDCWNSKDWLGTTSAASNTSLNLDETIDLMRDESLIWSMWATAKNRVQWKGAFNA